MKKILEKYKDKKLALINSEQKSKKKFNWLKNISLTAGGALALTFGILSLFSVPSVGVSVAVTGGLAILKAKKMQKTKEIEDKTTEKIKKHLEQIVEKQPVDNQNLNIKRQNKIKTLKKQKEVSTQKLTKLNSWSNVSLIAGLASGIAFYVIGSGLPIIPITVLGINAFSNYKATKELEKNQLLENRISNLENDLEAIKVIREEAKKVNKKKNQVPPVKKQKKTPVKTKANSKNEQLVDNYLKQLSNQKQPAKQIQKVKK